jgi:hypothetical protein
MIPAVICGAIFFGALFHSPLQAQARASSEEEQWQSTINNSQDPVALDEAFRSLIDDSLQHGKCDQGQEWLNQARDRKALRQIAAYMLEIGRCLEARAPDRARQTYQRIIVDYPDEKDEIGDNYADSARRRLIWLSNDRSWRVKSRSQLGNILSSAIRRRDFDSLRKYVSKVTFIFGACQSEFLNSDLDEIAGFLEENYSEKIRISQTIRRFPFHTGWFILQTRGWSSPYDYIYLLMQTIPGGWEWIGAIYCDEPL